MNGVISVLKGHSLAAVEKPITFRIYSYKMLSECEKRQNTNLHKKIDLLLLFLVFCFVLFGFSLKHFVCQTI